MEDEDVKDAVLFSCPLPLQSTCANCGVRLSVDSCVAFYTNQGSTMSVYQGLELIFKCREVTQDEVMPNLLKLCAACGHDFGKALKWYQKFLSATIPDSYVKHLIYGYPPVDASLVKMEATDGDFDTSLLPNADEPSSTFANVDLQNNEESGEKDGTSNSRTQKRSAATAGLTARAKYAQVERSYRCRTCNESFPTLSQIKKHRAEAHAFEDEIIQIGEEEASEEQKSSDEEEISSSEADEAEGGSGYEDEAVTMATSERRISARIMKQAAQSKLNRPNEEPKLYPCSFEFCGKVFTRNVHLTMHEAAHAVPRQHKCPECNLSYAQRKALDVHIKMAHAPDSIYMAGNNKNCRTPALSTDDASLLINTDYKCDSKECPGVAFQTFREWVVHQHEKHEVVTGYDLTVEPLCPIPGKNRPCPQCGRKAPSNPKMLLHIKTVHLRLKQFNCDECGRDFASRLGLKWHRKSAHDGVNKYTCSICSAAFPGRTFLETHEATAHSELRPFFCDEDGCGKYFRTNDTLRSHIKRTHPHRNDKKPITRRQARNMTEEEKALLATTEYKCDAAECAGVFYPTFKEWVVHQQSKHEVDTGYDLEQELLTPLPGKVRPCPRCGKKLKTRFGMLEHVQSAHLGIGRATCETCGKDFVNELSLKQHRAVIHDGTAPKFLCSQCGASFNSKAYLQQHEEIHSGRLRKSKDCDICGAKFRRKYNLALHKVEAHSQGEPSVCDVCGKVFKVKQRMEVHKRRQHVKKDIIDQICDLCGKGYAFKHYLKDHLVSVHKLSDEEARVKAKVKVPPAIRQYSVTVKPKTCEYCGRKYVRREQLFTHLMSVHGKTKEEAVAITGLETKRELVPGVSGRSKRPKRVSEPEPEQNNQAQIGNVPGFEPRTRMVQPEIPNFHHLQHQLPFYLG